MCRNRFRWRLIIAVCVATIRKVDMLVKGIVWSCFWTGSSNLPHLHHGTKEMPSRGGADFAKFPKLSICVLSLTNRASAFEAESRGFNSLRMHQLGRLTLTSKGLVLKISSNRVSDVSVRIRDRPPQLKI